MKYNSEKASIVLFLLFLNLSPIASISRGIVGETSEEADKRYGPALYGKTENGKTTKKFVKENTLIIIEEINGRILLAIYAKQNHKGQETGLSKPEIKAILQLHGGNPQEWTQRITPLGIEKFLKKKNLIALENLENGCLLVATSEQFKKWKKSLKTD